MMDKDTKEALEKGKQIKRLCDSLDWQEAKRLLERKISLLDSVTSIPYDLEKEELIRQIHIRQGAIDLVRSWIQEVEGLAQQSETNLEAMTVKQETEIIRIYPN